MIEERRKFIRIDAGMDFTYRLKGAKAAVEKAVTKNISPCGIGGFINKDIKKGAWLELSVALPGQKDPISAMGKVIWTADEKDGKINSGIKFEEIDADMKNRFLEHVCELMFSQLERLKV